jgi:lipopolysaccharide export system protein LptA
MPGPNNPRQGWPPSLAHPRVAAVRAGLLVALASGLVFVGLLGYYGLRPAPVNPRQTPDIPDVEPEADLLQGASGITIQLRDRKNAARQAGELTFAGMDPVADQKHMVRVDEPRAWFAFKDGAWLSVQSPAGLVYMPDRQRPPESGTLSGGVIVRMFEALPGGERPGESVVPKATFETSSIDFDTLLNTLTTVERWTARSAELDASGQGLVWKFSAARERTEYAEVTSDLRVTYRPAPDSASESPATPSMTARDQALSPSAAPAFESKQPALPGQSAVATKGPSPDALPTPLAAETQTLLYRLAFSGDVRIEQEGREIRSTQLDLWARLINGRLPEDAITPVRIASYESEPERAETAAWRPSAADPTAGYVAATDSVSALESKPATSLEPVAKQTTRTAAVTTPADNPSLPIMLTASGTTVLRALDETPNELASDHVAARFTAAPGTTSAHRVQAIDAIQGATIDADVIEYFATSCKGRIAGTNARPAAIYWLGQGTIEASAISADLSNGLIALDGAGQLTATPRGSDAPGRGAQCIRWSERGDVVLLMREGEIVPALSQAMFNGRVLAADDAANAAIEGDHLRADFVPASPRATETVLKRVIVDGRAYASADGDWLRSDRLVAEFDAPKPEAVRSENDNETLDASTAISSVVASGNVRGRTRDAHLSADDLHARLDRDERGRSIVREAIVTGHAVVESEDGVVARADRIESSPVSEIAELFGPGASVEREGTRIVGEHMRLDGRARRIDVFSPGTLSHVDRRQPEGSEPTITAQWTGSMAYDDSTREATCDGEVKAIALQSGASGGYTRDTIVAERVKLELEPAAEPASGDSTARSVKRAVAFGSIRDRADGTRAAIESRTVVADADGTPRLERLTYIESEELEADQSRSSAWARGPGKLLLIDEREPEPESEQAANSDGASSLGSTRGRTLFTWQGSGLVDQLAGRVELARNVSLIHTPLGKGDDLLLDADRLHADVAFQQDASGRPSTQGRLQRVTALGGATLTFGPREINADSLEYNAATGIVRAFAPTGGSLTIMDRRTASPQSARSLLWNIRTDEFVIDDPGTIVAPR